MAQLKHEVLVRKIEEQWGFYPCEIFPGNSPHQPKNWTRAILEGLRDLAHIASFEEAREILHRTIAVGRPLSLPVIRSAIAECLRTGVHATPISEKDLSVNCETDTRKVVFVASNGEFAPNSPSPSAQDVELGIRSGSSSPLCSLDHENQPKPEPPTSADAYPFSFASNHSPPPNDDPPNKRRRIEDSLIESLVATETTNGWPSSSRYDFDIPFRIEDASVFAERVASLVAWGRRNVEADHHQRSETVQQASTRLALLRSEEDRLAKQIKEAEAAINELNNNMLKFEEAMQSFRDIEEQEDRLAARKQELSASINLVPWANEQQQQQQQQQPQQAHAVVRQSQQVSLHLDGLQRQLRDRVDDKNRTTSELGEITDRVAATSKELDEAQHALESGRKGLRDWNHCISQAVSSGTTSIVEVDGRTSLEEGLNYGWGGNNSFLD
ncbi:hypothetical protein F5Y10DRAFT_248251 [Nemania abortiva]|nr:hypothetical protein F5Y10DRAFT_248251 [Nemania abortiva]